MRDNIETEQHWNKMHRLLDEKLSWNGSLIAETIDEYGDDGAETRRAYTLQFANYMSYQNVLYSAGAPLSEIISVYPKAVELFEKVWDKSFGYVQMIWMLSIGIMLNIDSEQISKLTALVKRDTLDDYLVNYLIHSIDIMWPLTETGFQFDDPYKETLAIINAPSKEDAGNTLSDYLKNKWYHGHREAAWHDRHKRKNSTYDGYWSYESGALARILQLDDSALENVPYYPYDMVHYQDKG
jgi:hypothetical protein